MNRPILYLTLTALLGAGGAGSLSSQTIAFEPVSPEPGDTVTISVTISACVSGLEKAVTPPGGAANGLIRLTLTENCACVATPVPVTLETEVGPLAFGTYDVELSRQFREPGGACCGSGCTPPEPLTSAVLTVGHGAGLVGLRPEPAHPVAGQSVSVAFETFCPGVWKEPRLEPAGGETRIVVDEDPEAPHPAAPCFSQPAYAVRLPVGPLAVGVYRLRVRTGPDSAHLEAAAESVFTVVPAGSVLALRQGRFRVRADWNAPGFGQGSAQGVLLTGEAGYFTFFDPDNVELIVKVLDGCTVNQRYWVFMAGLTDVGVTLSVEDTLTGHREIYSHPPGRPFQPILDTSKFATCP